MMSQMSTVRATIVSDDIAMPTMTWAPTLPSQRPFSKRNRRAIQRAAGNNSTHRYEYDSSAIKALCNSTDSPARA